MPDLGSYYRRLTSAVETGNPLWQAVVVETDGSTPARVGMKLAVPLQGEVFGNLGGGEMEFLVINAIRKEQPSNVVRWSYCLDEQGKTVSAESVQTSMICGGKAEVMVEPLFSPHPLFIIGAGHCGRALADFAVKADFRVTVIDNRKDLLQPEAFPREATLVYNDYADLSEAVTFNEQAYIVIMTYGHAHDRQVLELCLNKPFRYLGMIGSKKKVAETLLKVRQNGYAESEIQRVHSPVGLPIGSHTPYEIAVSILAELIMVRNKST